MELPSKIDEIPSNTKPSTTSLSLLSKDHLKISTNLCSTKLTQDGN